MHVSSAASVAEICGAVPACAQLATFMRAKLAPFRRSSHVGLHVGRVEFPDAGTIQAMLDSAHASRLGDLVKSGVWQIRRWRNIYAQVVATRSFF